MACFQLRGQLGVKVKFQTQNAEFSHRMDESYLFYFNAGIEHKNHNILQAGSLFQTLSAKQAQLVGFCAKIKYK